MRQKITKEDQIIENIEELKRDMREVVQNLFQESIIPYTPESLREDYGDFDGTLDLSENPRSHKHSIQDVFENGKILDSYPIDYNPKTGESESNGGQEFRMEYYGKTYLIQVGWDDIIYGGHEDFHSDG
jgi:hypothetical protein